MSLRPKPEELKHLPPPEVGHRWTDAEKEERVLAFLENYGNTGHIIESAKAVSVPYYQLLIWANEQAHLIPQIALAEASVRLGITGNAQYMALQGNEKMITLMVRQESERRKEGKKAGKTNMTMEASDETLEVIEIVKRAAAAFNNQLGAGNGNTTPEAAGEVPQPENHSGGDEGLREGARLPDGGPSGGEV